MEYKNMTDISGEQEDSLDSCKPQIIAKLKEYIEKDMPKKSLKKHSKFIKKALEAAAEQISFGTSPTYEMGYVYGNVSAKAQNYVGDTTYYKTIAVDLQTPERPFFKDGDRTTCFQACMHFGKLRKASYALVNKKYTWAVYRCDEEAKALDDYAAEVCGEQFRRIDYELTDTRVNDYEYVRTEPLTDCHFYPVYITTKNSRGKEIKNLIGYYDANKNSMDCNIDFNDLSASDIFYMILGIIFVLPPIIAVIVVILWLFGIIQV